VPLDGPVTLRPMRGDDLAATLDMWVASWQAAYPAIDFAERRPWMAERLAEHQRDGAHCLVALRAERTCGLLILNIARQYLDQIAVAVEELGSGLAETLLAEAKRLSPSGFGLHVNQDNVRAIRFYAKQGLRTVGEDVNPRSGAPIYMMRWDPGNP
jgi:putative acetyltransferase